MAARKKVKRGRRSARRATAVKVLRISRTRRMKRKTSGGGKRPGTTFKVLGTIQRKVKTMARRKRGRKSFSKGPAVKAFASGIGQTVKGAAFGALGIGVNKLIANQVVTLVKVDPKQKQLVELGTAVLLLPMLAKLVKVPALARASEVAAAVALYQAAIQYLPADVQKMVSGDEAQYYPVESASGADPVGFLPETGLMGFGNVYASMN